MGRRIRVCVVLALALGLGGRAWAEDARGTVLKGIEAIGGKAQARRLERLRLRMKGSATQGDLSYKFTQALAVELPGRSKSDQTIQFTNEDIRVVQVIDGDHGWVRAKEGVLELREQNLAQPKESLYTTRVESLLPLLEDKTFTLAALGESSIEGRPALGIKVSNQGHPEISLYFDKENGLLRQLHLIAFDPTTRRELRQDTYYSDYKDVEGVKRPMKLVILVEGRKVMECAITELKFVEKFEATEFAMP
jgi:hypothetical protein